VKTQVWIAMIVYLQLAILKERYALKHSLSQLLHFLEVNLFEKKSLLSIFQANDRVHQQIATKKDNQPTLFDISE
jgi:hypothetical protein